MLRGTLAAVVVAVGVVLPLYLLAIFPDVPGWMHSSRGRGWYVADALSNFWYRLAYCGLIVALATLLLAGILRDIDRGGRRR